MKKQTPLHIPADHPAFAGHFPGIPIVPGVVLLDEAIQAIAAEIGHAGGWSVASVKFLNALHEKKMDPESQHDAARQAHRPVETGVRGARA